MGRAQQYLANAVAMQRAAKIADSEIHAAQYTDIAAAWLDLAEEAQRLEREVAARREPLPAASRRA